MAPLGSPARPVAEAAASFLIRLTVTVVAEAAAARRKLMVEEVLLARLRQRSHHAGMVIILRRLRRPVEPVAVAVAMMGALAQEVSVAWVVQHWLSKPISSISDLAPKLLLPVRPVPLA